MKQNRISSKVHMLVLLLASVGYVGCAEDVGTIDRTNPNKVEKSLFQNNDEWWYRQSIIETDFQGTPNVYNVFTGLESRLKRIRWTITEDTLIAYSTVEPSIGATRGLTDPEDRRLGIVAAFPIQSHFDIQRSYNSSTGQLSNVISENSSDRPWNERKYMRVAWDSNQIDGVGLFSSEFGRISARKRTVPDGISKKDYNRTRISDDYIDVVNEYYLTPELWMCVGVFGYDGYANCEAGPVKLRHSFLKMPKKQVYEPLKYLDVETLEDKEGNPLRSFGYYSNTDPDQPSLNVRCDKELLKSMVADLGRSMEDQCDPEVFDMHKRYGFFRTERSVYDPRRHNWGEQRLWLANRWNIWQTAYDENGEVIPLSERKPRQIVYHVNAGFPEYMWEATQRLATDWNKVFTETVKLAHNYTTCDSKGIVSWMQRYQGQRDKAVISSVQGNSALKASKDALRATSDPVLSKILDLAKKELNERKALDDEYSQTYTGGSPVGLQAFCKTFQANVPTLVAQATTTASKYPDPQEQNISSVEKAAREKMSTYKTQFDNIFASYQDAKNVKCEIEPLVNWIEGYLAAREEALTYYFDQVEADRDSAGNYLVKVFPDIIWYESKDSVRGLLASLAENYLTRQTVQQNQSEIDGVCKSLTEMAPTPVMSETEKVKGAWNNITPKFDDKENTAVRKLIADSNNGDEHMYVIKRNACSAIELMEWYNKHGNVNNDVSELFSGQTKDTLAKLTPTKLEEFCAELEWATKDEEGESERFDWQRLGDLRYSFINFVTSSVPWLGYGPSAADPITGQIISGSANFAGQVLASYAASGGDYQMMFDGRISEDEMIWGDYVYKYLKQQTTFQNPVKPAASATSIHALGEGPTRRPVLPGMLPESILDQKTSQGLKQVPEIAKRYRSDYVQSVVSQEVKKAHLGKEEGIKRVTDFMNTPIIRQTRMEDPDFRDMVEALRQGLTGLKEQDALDMAYNMASNPTYIQAQAEKRSRYAAERNIMTFDVLDNAMEQVVSYIGSTNYFRDKPREEIETFFRDNIYYSTQLHEIGHTLGLRHNFGASADASNYHQAYWDLRGVLKQHDEIRKNNPNLTEEEKAKLITEDDLWYLPKERVKELIGYDIPTPYFNQAEYREASIMDYTPSLASGFAGLGRYDNAAIQFAYANKVEVYDRSVAFTSNHRFYHDMIVNYKNLPGLYAGRLDALSSDTAAEEMLGIQNMTRNRQWIDIEEAKQERVDAIYHNTELQKLYKNGISRGMVEADRTVPYVFCSDEYRGSQLSCDVFDWGATQTEILSYNFDNFRVFKNYRRYLRNRKAMGYQNAAAYVGWVAAILSKAQNPFYYYSVYQYFDLASFTDDLKEAAILAFNFMGEVFAQPEPGVYCKYDKANSRIDADWYYDFTNHMIPLRFMQDKSDCKDSFTVGRNAGGFYRPKLTYYEYSPRYERVGTYHDKDIALHLMYQISGHFAFSNVITDVRSSNISYWTQFQDEVYNFTRAVILNDLSGYAGVINANNEYEPPLIVDPETYDNGGENRQHGMERVFTTVGFGDEFTTMINSLIINNTYLDNEPDMVQFMKVCSSLDECYTDKANYPQGTKIVEFEHPNTPQKYFAPVAKDGKSITAEIIEKLNGIKENYLQVTEALETLTPGTENYKQALSVQRRYSQQMESHITKLDRIRTVMKLTRKLY